MASCNDRALGNFLAECSCGLVSGRSYQQFSGRAFLGPGYAENAEFFEDNYHKTHKTGSKDLPRWSQNLPVATKRHPRASRGLPKGAQVGQNGSQAGCQADIRVVQRHPQGVPRAPQGSPQVPRPFPGVAPGEKSWNLLWGDPEKHTKIWPSRFQDLSVQSENSINTWVWHRDPLEKKVKIA